MVRRTLYSTGDDCYREKGGGDLVAPAPVPFLPTPRSPRSITRLLLLGVAIVSLACGTDGNNQQSPERAIATCAEVDRGRRTPGDEVVIADDPSPQRTILTSPSGLRSRTHSGWHWHRSPDPRDVGCSRVGLARHPEREPRSHRVPDSDG